MTAIATADITTVPTDVAITTTTGITMMHVLSIGVLATKTLETQLFRNQTQLNHNFHLSVKSMCSKLNTPEFKARVILTGLFALLDV